MQVQKRSSIETIERECEAFVNRLMIQDSAHDMAHLKRVVSMAKQLAKTEQANLYVVVPAAWMHDLVNMPKSHPERHLASYYSAVKSEALLMELGFRDSELEAVKHAIIAHSFSANVVPNSREAKVVQDADRLDALGAIGVARCMMIGGKLDRALYDLLDPFSEQRALRDDVYTLDHFFQKLLRLEGTFQTTAGEQEAACRTQFIRDFLTQLASEIAPL